MFISLERRATLFPDVELGEYSPHHELVEKAYKEITEELDAHGNTVRLDELRRQYFERFAKFWQMVLDAYQTESQKRGLSEFSGEEVEIGNAVVSARTVDAGYLPNGLRLIIKRRTEEEESELSIVVSGEEKLEIDEVFVPELSTEIIGRIDDTSYSFKFLNGSVLAISRDIRHERTDGIAGSVHDRRNIEFPRYNLSQPPVLAETT